jgi:hypothetical protein
MKELATPSERAADRYEETVDNIVEADMGTSFLERRCRLPERRAVTVPCVRT